MTRAERMRFIDEQLKGLWPQWTPTEAEMSLWMSVLARFDYAFARDALRQVYCTAAGNYQRPRPGPFLAHARRLVPHLDELRRSLTGDRPTEVFVECIEPPSGHPHWRGHRKGVYVTPAARQTDRACVRAAAEAMARRCQQTYGGQWITVVEA